MSDVKMAPVTRVADIYGGKPIFAGTRVPVRRLFEYLEEGSDLAEFLEDFPTVGREQAVATLEVIRAELDDVL